MKAVLAVSVAALFSLAQSQVTVNTPPQLVECQPIQITWSGGVSPYFLSVFPDGNPSVVLENLSNSSISGTSFTWEVNIASGQSVGFAVRDSTGVTGQSAAVGIQAGTSTTCVGQSVSGSAASGTTSSSPASTGGSSGATTTAGSTSGTSASKSAGSSGSSGTSTSASASTTTNAASSQSAQLGFAGIVAALVALLA